MHACMAAQRSPARLRGCMQVCGAGAINRRSDSGLSALSTLTRLQELHLVDSECTRY